MHGFAYTLLFSINKSLHWFLALSATLDLIAFKAYSLSAKPLKQIMDVSGSFTMFIGLKDKAFLTQDNNVMVNFHEKKAKDFILSSYNQL